MIWFVKDDYGFGFTSKLGELAGVQLIVIHFFKSVVFGLL
jgi:hypothetical protein